MGKINRTKLLDRQSNRRDAKLFIIATEGQVTEKQYFETRLKTSLGSYNKSNLDSSLYKSKVKEAINRGKLLHPNLQQKWPPSIGTHVHRLVEVILQSLN
jgi:hypothetical protein